ncbi:MAG: SIS domain-containing protein [Bacteroidota bacterium]|nr:SIS domain-containing protein [Bacteroidota bacterium]
MYEYHQASSALLNQIVKTNKKVFPLSIDWVSKTIIEDRIIHTFGTGHSHIIGLELFIRAGGLANVNAFLDSIVMTSEGARRSAEIERISGVSKVLWDQYKIDKEDLFIIISNSGRNAMPIEMAEHAKANGNKVIAITSIEQSKKYPVRIKGQKKLYEIADLVIDNCVPPGDGMLQIGGELTGAASTIAGCFIVNLMATEAMKIAAQEGVKLPVYYSQNIDGFDNETLYERYKDRIKHL